MTPRQHTSHDPERPTPFEVIPNTWIAMPDGTLLAARIWLPARRHERPVSAILDYVPYRKGDGTAVNDAAWGSYFAGHGFAFVRVDIRGSGDSQGHISDEYSEREQDDAEAVIAWISAQSWCSGSVGMIGVSWGGFSALQLAARAPATLQGVVPIYASDDRYTDDVHYVGGCVSAMDMAQWATSMLAYINQPPDPELAGDDWRAVWRERIENASLFIEPWLTHQRRDHYWSHGSACERYAAIRCPVFAVGGWSDGYRDMVMRVLEHVRAPVRGIIGPWGHVSPERGVPGPAIGFLQECVRFFAAALDGCDNGFFDEPALISYMQDPVAPSGDYTIRPGRWVADSDWPSRNVSSFSLRLGAVSLQADAPRDDDSITEAPRRCVRGLQTTGADGGVWCGDGSPGDFGLDQRFDDGASLCWDTPPLSERIELLGKAELRLPVSVDTPQALVVARLCDVAPDGASTLVARGVLNLSRREGHDRTVPMPIDTAVTVTIPFQATAYAIPAGHRIRLAITNAYWPLTWPSPQPGTLTVHCGPDAVLLLPRRAASGGAAPEPSGFGPPETGTPLAIETTMLRTGGRVTTRDLATGEVTIRFDWHPARTLIAELQTEIGEENATTYRIVEGDPLSATVVSRVTTTLARPGQRTRVIAETTMTADCEEFLVTTTLDAYDGESRIGARTETHRIPRDGV